MVDMLWLVAEIQE